MALLTWAVLLLAGLSCTCAVGIQTPIQNIPSIVQVEFRIVTLWNQQCVGSIITNFHILSAAACFQADISGRRIRAGSSVRGQGGVIHELETIINHSDFGSNGKVGDISVVRVADSFWFGPTVAATPIVNQNFVIPALVDVNLFGFGVTAQGGLVGDGTLHTAVLQTKAYPLCQLQYPGQIQPSMLCVGLAGLEGRDFDASDAGAPIVFSGYLTGVVSFGTSSNNDDLPVVATSVGTYTDWIVSAAV